MSLLDIRTKKKKKRSPMRKSPMRMKNEKEIRFLEKEFLKIS